MQQQINHKIFAGTLILLSLVLLLSCASGRAARMPEQPSIPATHTLSGVASMAVIHQ